MQWKTIQSLKEGFNTFEKEFLFFYAFVFLLLIIFSKVPIDNLEYIAIYTGKFYSYLESR